MARAGSSRAWTSRSRAVLSRDTGAARMELYFRLCYQARETMNEMCNTPSCNGIRRCARRVRAHLRQVGEGAIRWFASGALLAAAACAGGSDASVVGNETRSGSASEAPAVVPFSADGAQQPGPGEPQGPEPNATETNFITLVCWEDSDCPGGTCQLYASDAGAPASASSATDAGTPDVDRSGPPLGRCLIP
jgi:hypothetical protein